MDNEPLTVTVARSPRRALFTSVAPGPGLGREGEGPERGRSKWDRGPRRTGANRRTRTSNVTYERIRRNVQSTISISGRRHCDARDYDVDIEMRGGVTRRGVLPRDVPPNEDLGAMKIATRRVLGSSSYAKRAPRGCQSAPFAPIIARR